VANESVEQRIRAGIYFLWQENGAMEGCADEYWRKARSEVEAEMAGKSGTSDGTSVPAKTRPPGAD
jgi:pyruvoyl-dependent arginine decarboxylase (PvlArgDC)